MDPFTGDYSSVGDPNENIEWDGATCKGCGSISSSAFCGDCLEDGILLDPTTVIEEPSLSESRDPIQVIATIIIVIVWIHAILYIATMYKLLSSDKCQTLSGESPRTSPIR